ncbi:hypothetical protein F4810DRAFT_20872 [Camillea tinctor]|nr:hypothetical protein F4810DRAFT_20872 [Camillea tinctor]
MADSHGGPSSILEKTGLDATCSHEQAQNNAGETQVELGSRAEAHEEAIKDQVDGAIAQGPKKADQSTGGRVSVGETGDLHDLAAKRQSS